MYLKLVYQKQPEKRDTSYHVTRRSHHDHPFQYTYKKEQENITKGSSESPKICTRIFLYNELDFHITKLVL